jgi:hypothetical protein
MMGGLASERRWMAICAKHRLLIGPPQFLKGAQCHSRRHVLKKISVLFSSSSRMNSWGCWISPLDDLSPRGRLTIMVRSLLLVVQEGASMIDISDPILLRDLAKGKSPQSMGAQSQAFNRDSMYLCLIKLGILARLALVEGLDPVVVRTLVGVFVG